MASHDTLLLDLTISDDFYPLYIDMAAFQVAAGSLHPNSTGGTPNQPAFLIRPADLVSILPSKIFND
jgi:hypothetical protein